MITEGSGSCFSVLRQTRAVFMGNAARNIKSRQRIKFPTPLVLWSNAPPQVRCGSSNFPLPGQGRGSNARGMPGRGGMCEFRIDRYKTNRWLTWGELIWVTAEADHAVEHWFAQHCCGSGLARSPRGRPPLGNDCSRLIPPMVNVSWLAKLLFWSCWAFFCPIRHRGNTYLTSLWLVSVRCHSHVNSVNVEIKFHLERKLSLPCAQFMLRQMHWTYLSVSIGARYSVSWLSLDV